MTTTIHVDCPTCGRVQSTPALATVVTVVRCKPTLTLRYHLTFACPSCGDVCSAFMPWPLTEHKADEWLDLGAEHVFFAWDAELDDGARAYPFKTLTTDMVDRWADMDPDRQDKVLAAIVDYFGSRP